MKTRTLSALLLLALAASLWAAGQPAVTRLLPGANDKALPGWKPLADGLQYGKGESLTNIYDGGYQDYVDAGVVDAARNLYQRGKDMVEVTVHTMKSARAAEAFFNREVKANDAKRVTFALPRPPGAAPQPKHAMAIAATREQALGYAYAGKYYITVTSMYGGTKARKDVGHFLEVVLKKAAAAAKASK